MDPDKIVYNEFANSVDPDKVAHNEFANSVDPGKVAHKEQRYLDPQCLPSGPLILNNIHEP